MFPKILLFVLSFLFSGQVLAGELPSYTKLCGMLKDLSGWKAEECTGLNASNPMGDMASATRTYTKDDMELEVNLILGSAAMAVAGPMAFQQTLEVNSPEEYLKITNVDGFRVGIQYDKKNHTGSVAIFLRDFPRNMDPASANQMALLVVNYQNMGWKEALSWAKKFDWGALKKSLE